MVSSASPDPSGFAAIAQPRAHDFVVEQLRRQIGLGIIAPGTSLPPERELMRMFGVGRATVQLAIGKLEAEHIVETRRGRSGGSFVKAPNSDTPALDYRVVELRRHADRVFDAVELREIVEPAAAAIAAVKGKRGLVKNLLDLVHKTEQAADDAEFMRWDTAFHLAIAEATENNMLFESLERIRLELNPALQLLPDTQLWHQLSNEEHVKIVEAIKAKDEDSARDAMAAHITHANRSIRGLVKSLSKR